MDDLKGFHETTLLSDKTSQGWSVFYIESQTFVRRHCHAYLEILFLFKGQCRMRINTRWHELKQGDFFAISAGSSHEFPDLTGCIFFVMQIKTDFLCSSPSGSEWRYLIPFLQADQNCLAHCHLADTDPLRAILRAIEQDDRDKPQGYDLDIKGNLFCLFAQLIRRGVITYPKTEQGSLLRKLEPALTHLEKNCGEKVKISHAAHLCFMSEQHFSRCFHQATGRTFKDYVQHIRMQKVWELLTNTDLPIEIIALQTGFSTASHLSAVFRKINGASPSAWRRQNPATKSGDK